MSSDTRIEWLPPRPLPDPPAEPAAPPPAHDPEPPSRTGVKRLIGPLAVLGLFLAKFKSVLLLLPKIKVLTTSGSMLVSVGAYALIWGWKFAVGFVLLLFVHEMGHVIQLRREGIPASAPLFIPFLGAVVAARSLGGRAMAAMAPWMWFVGFAALIGLVFVAPNPILFLIVLIGGLETWRRWKQRRAGGDDAAAYYRVKPAHRGIVFAVYVGLIVVCAIGMDFTFVERDFDDA